MLSFITKSYKLTIFFPFSGLTYTLRAESPSILLDKSGRGLFKEDPEGDSARRVSYVLDNVVPNAG